MPPRGEVDAPGAATIGTVLNWGNTGIRGVDTGVELGVVLDCCCFCCCSCCCCCMGLGEEAPARRAMASAARLPNWICCVDGDLFN